MEITETGVNERLQKLYELSRNGGSTALKAPVDAAEAAAEENTLKRLGRAALKGDPITAEERGKIKSDADNETHSANIKSLQTKASAALQTSGWDIVLEKGMSAVKSIFKILGGNIMEGLQDLKNGAGRAISELWDAFKDWKVGSSDHGFMDTVEKHEKLRNLNKLASQELGISDPKERERVVAQLAGEAPLPVQVSGGATVTGDQSPTPGGKTGGKSAGK